MTDKIGCLIIDIEGKELTPEDRELLTHPLVGGLILFKRNYESPQQLKSLCSSIRKLRQTPRLIMVDQEGGRVQRFIEGFTRLPTHAFFGELYEHDRERSIRVAKETGWLLATELAAYDIDVSLAPVLDLNRGMATVIGTRAFHANHDVVIPLAHAYIQGMREAGMTAVGKHFPGHGAVIADSHLSRAFDNRPLAVIEAEDLQPFKQLARLGLNAMMTAHVVFSSADHLPATYSKFWLNHILRETLGFTGTIISDDLSMEGANISSNYADRVNAAKDAGCDFILLCNERRGVIKVLDELKGSSYCVDNQKWKSMKRESLPADQDYKRNPRWQKAYDLLINIQGEKARDTSDFKA